MYAAGILASFWVLVAALLGLRAAGATLGWGFQFQSPVFLALMAGLLFFLGLSLAGQFEIGLTLTSAGGSLAAKAGLYRQLLYRSAGGGGGHALHGALHGSGGRIRVVAMRDRDVHCLHGAGIGTCGALRCPHDATGVDAAVAQTRRVDGSAAAGRRSADFCHGDLAGLGACQRLWRQSSGRASGQLPAARHRRVVPRALAG